MLDFGGQYSQLIARRIRECGVYAELLPHDTALESIRERAPRALVLSGGPASVYSEGAPELRGELLELGIPVLGICYGMQAMVLARRPRRGRRGRRVRPHPAHPLRRRRPAARRAAVRATVLDEPPRLGLRAAGRIRGARRQPGLAGGRLRGHGARPVRDPVPSRGRPHALRPAGPRPLPARDRRLRRDLVARLGDRRAGREDPRRRSATPASSAGSRAGSTRRPRPRSSIARSATSSPACSSTTG